MLPCQFLSLTYLLVFFEDGTWIGSEYSRHKTSASCASILHISSMNCNSCILMLPARSPEARCFPSGDIL